jgi:uncharacterized protein (DUF427 family)
MSTRVRDIFMRGLGDLRYEPIEKRIRATLGDDTVLDSTRAMLVWEPKRVVPSYAVPEADVAGEVAAGAAAPGASPEADLPQLGGLRVLDPSIPFGVHSTDGEAVVVRPGGGGREASGFRPADEALAGYVVLDFDDFDAWYEEDERNLAHPRDPFHRIDIVHSSRHVRVERDGVVLADTTSPYLLFETSLPVRYYLPPEDVATDLLRPSSSHTFCAYKGRASYWSHEDDEDLAWTYREPLREAAEVTDRIAFFNERIDIVVDGTLLERPVTPWSRRA